MSLGKRLSKLVGDQPPREWKVRPEVLLHNNIPKPLHQVNPRTILGQTWWNKTRQEAYASTNFHCVACGTHRSLVRGTRKHLEGHELYEINYAKGRSKYIETVPLCPYCHSYIHDGRLRMLMESGRIHYSKFVAVIQHGDAVLAKAGLSRLTHNEREARLQTQPVAEWSTWRLVLNGKLYKPKFKTYEIWLAAMTQSNYEED